MASALTRISNGASHYLHEHKSTGTCLLCAIKHMGAAKVKLGEAIASSDPERRQRRLLDVTFEMNEAETTHLSAEYPEFSKKVRDLRKSVEEAAYGEELKVSTKDIDGLIDDMVGRVTKGMVMNEKQREGIKEALANTAIGGYPPDEEFREVLPVTPDNVLKAIRHYEGEYKAPASISDIQFILTIPHGSPTDKDIDRHLALAPPDQVQRALDELSATDKIKTTEFGGYVNPDYAKTPKGFNIAKTINESRRMLSGKEIAVIAGSQFAAKGTEKVMPMLDQNLGLRDPFWNLDKIGTPAIGAALLLLTLTKYGQRMKANAQLALVSYAAHLLTDVVDTALVLMPGSTQGFRLQAVPGTQTYPASARFPIF